MKEYKYLLSEIQFICLLCQFHNLYDTYDINTQKDINSGKIILII